MKCVCFQVLLLGSLAVGAGSVHLRFASENQKEMMADILQTESKTTAIVDNADRSATYSIDTLPEMLSIDQARWLFDQSALATGDANAPEIYFIDARHHRDYLRRRVWGAYSVPPDSFSDGTLPEEIEYWPRDTTILVAYCRGGNCDASHIVSTRLRLDKQFEHVHILTDGLPGWIDAQLPTDSGEPDQ